jgi:hypothetical protein
MTIADMVTEVPAPIPMPRTVGTALAEYMAIPGLDPHWMLAGVTFPAFGCDLPAGVAALDPCVVVSAEEAVNIDLPDADDEDEDADTGACVKFTPFQIRAYVEVSTVTGWSQAQLGSFARAKLDLVRSAIVAREVMTGSLTTVGYSFVEEADTVTGIDSSPTGALGAVETALGDKIGNGIGMIHLTQGLLTHLVAEGALLEVAGGGWVTANGHRVVADSGYRGPAPTTGVVTAATPYIYGSGPVMYATGERLVVEGWENMQWGRNIVGFSSMETAVVAYEPCTVVAALVDMTP